MARDKLGFGSFRLDLRHRRLFCNGVALELKN
jgi:hypothetical protein